MDDPDVYERGETEERPYETDEDDFIIEPEDNDLETEEEDDYNV